MTRLLVVDDEPNVRSSFQRLLSGPEVEVLVAASGLEAVALVEAGGVDVVVMDIQMPGQDGLAALRRLRATAPRLPVILMTGYGTTDTAIEATKQGAFDYLLKPFEPEALLELIDRALESARLMGRGVALDPARPAVEGDALVGQHRAMQEVYKAIGRVAPTDATVLIRGETGTGKELVARAIYQHSRRRDQPLVMVNCAAIPETLLESELFGYEKGAFTGAVARRIGRFEQAAGGTVFLDEVGDLALGTQAKILRVLQERCLERLGGNQSIPADVRVLAATNRDLEAGIAEGTFREDLYHRLDVVTIRIPPLRERREDIPRLTDYFLARFAAELEVEPPPLADEARQLLERHPWPGNVRQLEHCIQRLLIFTRGRAITSEDVRQSLAGRADGAQVWPGEGPVEAAGTGPALEGVLRETVRRFLGSSTSGQPHRELMELVDRLVVAEALELTAGNQSQAARLLGLTRPTLQARMVRYGLSRGGPSRGPEIRPA